MHKTITIALIILVASSVAEAEQSACDKISSQTENVQSFLNPPSSYKVIGERRSYFYSAPHENCRSKDIFVVTGDDLIAYTEYKGWYSVSYANPKTGKDYDGWIKSERLKRTGAIRPETR